MARKFVGGAVTLLVLCLSATDSPFRDVAAGRFVYGGVLALLPGTVLIFGLLAPLVSYRRRDALFLLVPIWGVVVVWIIGSRIATLPERDWPQQPQEPKLARVEHHAAEG